MFLPRHIRAGAEYRPGSAIFAALGAKGDNRSPLLKRILRHILPVGGEFPIVLPRRLNESTLAVMQPDANRIPRQVSLRGCRTGVAFNRLTVARYGLPALASHTGQAAIGV
jgi:hypothetical protein